MDFMGQGHSVRAWCGKSGVPFYTTMQWCIDQHDFRDAVFRGHNLSQLYWERQLMSVVNEDLKGKAATAVIFALKTRFKSDWGETEVDFSRMDDRELIERVMAYLFQSKNKNVEQIIAEMSASHGNKQFLIDKTGEELDESMRDK